MSPSREEAGVAGEGAWGCRGAAVVVRSLAVQRRDDGGHVFDRFVARRWRRGEEAHVAAGVSRRRFLCVLEPKSLQVLSSAVQCSGGLARRMDAF